MVLLYVSCSLTMGLCMSRPSKVYERSFCRGLELPLSYRCPADCIEWLSGYVSCSGGYFASVVRVNDVLLVWRWLSYDVAAIARRLCMSRRHASTLFDYVVKFDKYVSAYMLRLSDSLPLIELAGYEPRDINRWGLNFNRLAMVNRAYLDELDSEGTDSIPTISRDRLREVLDRL